MNIARKEVCQGDKVLNRQLPGPVLEYIACGYLYWRWFNISCKYIGQHYQIDNGNLSISTEVAVYKRRNSERCPYRQSAAWRGIKDSNR